MRGRHPRNGVCVEREAETGYQLRAPGVAVGPPTTIRLAYLACTACGYAETYCVGSDPPRLAEYGSLVEAPVR